MSKSKVRMDGKELLKLKEQIELLGDPDNIDEFLSSCAKELAARLLRKVSMKTPTGKYPDGSGKVGGTLKRGWTIGNVVKTGSYYIVEVINPVVYASYVENGHRQEVGRYVPAIGKRLVNGWVKGKFFLKISEKEIQNNAPAIIEKKLRKYLEECFKK